MRPKFTIVMVAMIAGCAGHPVTPKTQPLTVAGKESPSAAEIVDAGGKYNLEALANARKLGFTPINQDGQVLYCRRDLKTGSHVERETVCMTLVEIERLRDQTQQNMGDFAHRTLPPPGK